VLDRAWPRNQSECVVADAAAVDLDHGRVGRELAGDELVRLQDREHLLDARVALQRQGGQRLALADRTDHGRLAPRTIRSSGDPVTAMELRILLLARCASSAGSSPPGPSTSATTSAPSAIGP